MKTWKNLQEKKLRLEIPASGVTYEHILLWGSSTAMELLEQVQRRHQDCQRDGAPLLLGKAGIVHPGEAFG